MIMTSPGQQSLPASPFDPTALVIYGGGGQGRVLIDMVRTLGAFRLAGIIDDGLQPGTEMLGVPVLGGAEKLEEIHRRGVRLAANAVGGIGNPAVRLQVFETLASAGFVCPNLVHPTAFVESSAILEGGVQILANSYVSSAARVGFGTLINAGVVVSHDCQLGRCVNLSPGASLAGGVCLEDFVQVGMNATINVGLKAGAYARIGNGATVKADVPAGGRVYAGAIWPEPPRKKEVRPA